MKKMLITGFDPFGGETINPAWEAVSALPDKIGDFCLEKMQIPTVFGIGQRVIEAAKDADAVLCIGQAGGRDCVTPEYVAINLRHANICDNEGNMPKDLPVIEGAPTAYFATVPVRAMTDAIAAHGIAAKVSYSAGTFVCNDVLYSILHTLKIPCGFIHVPYLPQQAKDGVPSMPLEEIVQALQAAIESM